ncbi:MAG: BTAD domain-containing putative transcriptional regulator, partial [Micromonosporaceae bacterium]
MNGTKPRMLLATLLLHPNEPVSTDLLTDVLWPTSPPRSAVANLRTYVSTLRTALGGSLISARPRGYVIHLGPRHLDLFMFEELTGRASQLSRAGQQEPSLELLEQAIRIWRGPPLADLPSSDAWSAPLRKLAERRLAAIETRLDLLVSLAHHSTAICELRDLLTEDPLRENLWHKLLLALLAAGRRAEALAAYTQLRQVLNDELGIEPSPESQRIHAMILAGEDHPQATFASTFPICQLPADLSDFTGRASELQAVRQAADHAAASTAPTVIVVSGPPGVGKTSLAVHAAHELRRRHPDGQLHVELGGAASPLAPEEALAGLLRALGVSAEAIPETLRERAALYRSRLADRKVLLLLDDAASFSQVQPLLPATAGCVTLVTCRARLLELAGGRQIELSELPDRDAMELFSRVAGRDRTTADPQSAGRVASACSGLPLALRIAGAKLAHHHSASLRQLADRLEDESRRLGELRLGALDVMSGLAASVQNLSPDTARALRLLASLGPPPPTGWPDWVVGAALDRHDVSGVLEALSDANLVHFTSCETVGGPRRRIGQLLRLHASQQAVPELERAAALARVLSGWLALAEAAASRLHGNIQICRVGDAERWRPDDTTFREVLSHPLAWFDTERPTLVNAVGKAAAAGLDGVSAELAIAITPYLDLRSHHDDWLRTHCCALAAARRGGATRAEAALQRGLGQLAVYQDRDHEAVTHFQQAAALFTQAKDESGAAMAACGVATCARLSGRHQEALALYRRALAVFQRLDEPHNEAYARYAIGTASLSLGRLDEAQSWYESALRG